MSSGGFTHGDDFVAARLAVDIPTEGVASIRELTQEIERFRVGVESAARCTDNWNQYLNASAEAAQRAAAAQQNLLDTVQRVTDMQQRIATGGGAASPAGGTSVPQAYVDPFSGTSAGMGRALPGELPPVNLDAVSGQISALRQTDPRTYLNMQSARGNIQPGDITSSGQLEQTAARVAARDATVTQQIAQNPPADHAPGSTDTLSGLGGIVGGINQGSRMASQIMNELGPGGSVAGLGRAAVTGLDAMSALSDRGSAAGLLGKLGSLGGLAKGAGVAGGVLTAGLAANGLFQAGGEQIQQFANMGSVRGGGAAEGFGQEMAIRSMAMNPFLTTEQSRQIIQGALTEGYSGKQFDSVTQFMASNLKDMNLDVASSVQLLRKEVNEGGQSVSGLAANLGILKELSKSGSASLPELQANFAATSGALVSAGIDAPGAERAAMVAGRMWNSNMSLKDLGSSFLQTAASSPSMQATIWSMSGQPLPKGALPGTLFQRSSTKGLAELSGALKQYAQMAQQSSLGDPANGAYIFYTMLSGQGFQLDRGQAKLLYGRLISGEDAFADASKQVDDAAKAQTSVQSRNPLSAAGGGWVSQLAALGNGFVDFASTGRSSIADIFSGQGSRVQGRFGEMMHRQGGRQDAVSAAASLYRIPMLDQVIAQYGQNGIEILDQNGKVVDYDADNRGQMDGLSNGSYTWRPKGSQGHGIKVSDTPQGADNFKDRVAQVQGTLRIEMDPAAARAGVRVPDAIQLTPHEQQANAGYGNATPNNAAPGEGPITRGAR